MFGNRHLEEDAKEPVAARAHVPDTGAAAATSSGAKAAALKVSVDAAGAAAAGDWHHEIEHKDPVKAIEEHHEEAEQVAVVEDEAVQEEGAVEPQAEERQVCGIALLDASSTAAWPIAWTHPHRQQL